MLFECNVMDEVVHNFTEVKVHISKFVYKMLVQKSRIIVQVTYVI